MTTMTKKLTPSSSNCVSICASPAAAEAQKAWQLAKIRVAFTKYFVDMDDMEADDAARAAGAKIARGFLSGLPTDYGEPPSLVPPLIIGTSTSFGVRTKDHLMD